MKTIGGQLPLDFRFSPKWKPNLNWGWRPSSIPLIKLEISQKKPISGRNTLYFAGPNKNGLQSEELPLPLPERLEGSALFRGKRGDGWCIFLLLYTDKEYKSIKLGDFICMYDNEIRVARWNWVCQTGEQYRRAFLLIESNAEELYLDEIRLLKVPYPAPL
ncbi:MAG: hypothetical protein GX280_07065 [Lentisphaerae bacterium]|nr:hypothetical protein [Victivallaceae bacterium]NLK83826.1 hypothetical protein [Lentisphaerota bacterium]